MSDSVLGAIVVPHPPMILPNIGKGEEACIANIDAAYRKAAKTIVDQNPDTVVIISPHAPSYFDYMQISSGPSAHGDMSQFRDWKDAFTIAYDTELVNEICALADQEGLPAGTLGSQQQDLDHGTMIPLYYLKDLKPDTKFVRVGIGGPNQRMHYKLGELIAQAADNLGRKISVVASGDLSHCQKAGTGYGFKACGPEYDKKIMELLSDQNFLEMIELPEKVSDDAMVCGQKPFCVMAGTLDGKKMDVENLGHSAVTGVGYGVVTFENPTDDDSRHFLIQANKDAARAMEEQMAKEDEYVRLARKTIDEYIRYGRFLPIPKDLSKELYDDKAGAFVSIHKNGQLRGCIGTTEPTKANLAMEIMNNAISASVNDPRFPAIQPWELDDLDISVDVLGQPEPIESEDELDVKKYGVIVTKGRNRGLLLPDLDGVNTVDQQVAIAKQKAGLKADEKGCLLERFEVTRHH